MSDEDKESKSEAASERRLNQLAEEGNIPMGRDVAAAGAFAAGIATLGALSGRIGPLLVDRIQGSMSRIGEPFSFAPWLPIFGLGGAVCAAAALGAAIPLVIQTQGRVWSNLALPDLSKLWKTERLTRIDKETIAYEMRVEDPKTYTAPFKVAFPIRQEPGYQNFEYGCHEGNHGMMNQLSGSRADERAAEEAAKQKQ